MTCNKNWGIFILEICINNTAWYVYFKEDRFKDLIPHVKDVVKHVHILA